MGQFSQQIPNSARLRNETDSVLVGMADMQKKVDSGTRKPVAVEKVGNVQVPIYGRSQVKKGRTYQSFTVIEWCDGKRVLRTFASRDEAREKAKGIAEAIATGRGNNWIETLTTHERANMSESITLAAEAGFGASYVSAMRLLRDAVKIVGGPDQLLVACQFYVANCPSTRVTAKPVSEVVSDFLARRRGKLSARRSRTEACYLGTFEEDFPGRKLHEIAPLELSDAIDRKGWSAKTRNDFLGTVGLLFEDAVMRGWAAVNIAKNVKRGKVNGGEIGVFTPSEAKTLLSSLSSDLRAAIALWCFCGLRKEEIARLTWAEVSQGLASGSIYLPATKAKTGQGRSVPISPNLRAWLEKYRKPSGPVLPEQWDGRNLDSLTRHLATRSGIAWKGNGPRHSFATYSLAKGDKAADVVKAMGNSLRMLESHYWSRSASVTEAMAKEWFSIMPDDCAAAKGEQAQEPETQTRTEEAAKQIGEPIAVP